MAVADQYDALRNARVYKLPYDHATAVSVITQGDDRTRPGHFDPRVLAAFQNIATHFEDTYERLRDTFEHAYEPFPPDA